MKTISVSKRIRVPAQAAWEVVRTGAQMDRWVPAITSCALEGSGVGAKRTCVINGQELLESIETVDDTSRLACPSRRRLVEDEHQQRHRNTVLVMQIGHAERPRRELLVVALTLNLDHDDLFGLTLFVSHEDDEVGVSDRGLRFGELGVEELDGDVSRHGRGRDCQLQQRQDRARLLSKHFERRLMQECDIGHGCGIAMRVPVGAAMDLR